MHDSKTVMRCLIDTLDKDLDTRVDDMTNDVRTHLTMLLSLLFRNDRPHILFRISYIS